MDQNWKNGSRLVKCVILGKISHTWKKWVTCGKTGQNWLNVPHLVKWVTLGKMGPIWLNVSNLVKWVTLENIGSHLEK